MLYFSLFPTVGFIHTKFVILFTLCASAGLLHSEWFFVQILFLEAEFTEKLSKILLSVATTKSLSKCEVGRAFLEGSAYRKLMNPISLTGTVLSLKFKGKSRLTQRVTLLCVVFYHESHLAQIKMLRDPLQFQTLSHINSSWNVSVRRLLPKVLTHLMSISFRGCLKVKKRTQ